MKRLTRILAAVFSAQVLVAAPTGASNDLRVIEDSTPFQATYTFYIGGLSIADIALSGEISPLGYEADSVVETRGILDLLVGGRVTAEARGYRHTKGHLAPDAYRTEYATRSEARAVTMDYIEGVADVAINPPEPPKPYDTNAAEHPGTLDPVTAAVTMMTPGDTETLCNRTIPVFDGKRRYDIILLPLDRRPATDKNPPLPSWETPMVRCFGVYERIAGFEADLQGAQRYFPFDIWFESDGSGVHRIVRLAGKTKLGYAIGNLKK